MSHPMLSTTIQGITFSHAARYVAGHVTLTEGEAKALNQTLSENLRNNFAGKVKKAIDTHAVDGLLPSEIVAELEKEFAEFEETYEFSVRTQRASVDPVHKEAHKLAKEMVMGVLRAKKIDVKSLAEGKLDEFIARVLASKPEITEEARRRIHAVKSVAASAIYFD